jgi:5'-nucleotidase (lipoprotein e(P4) family)
MKGFHDSPTPTPPLKGRGFWAALCLSLGACATAPAAPPAAAGPPASPSILPGIQWLYGSGESAASSLQAYRAFRDHALAAARSRPAESVVLAPAATLAAPAFLPCGDKPLAVVLDVDETALQNLGAEYDQAVHDRGFDQARWERWERTGADKVLAIPGAAEALGAVRQAGMTVIFISNRKAANAAFTEQALDHAGLGPARNGETLLLQAEGGSGKDARRATVAARYCVVAMAGDQLGDFSDLFNAKGLGVGERRRAAAAFAGKWGSGWFMLSNPVYGPSLRGTLDEIFPAERRWSDPQEGNH